MNSDLEYLREVIKSLNFDDGETLELNDILAGGVVSIVGDGILKRSNGEEVRVVNKPLTHDLTVGVLG